MKATLGILNAVAALGLFALAGFLIWLHFDFRDWGCYVWLDWHGGWQPVAIGNRSDGWQVSAWIVAVVAAALGVVAAFGAGRLGAAALAARGAAPAGAGEKTDEAQGKPATPPPACRARRKAGALLALGVGVLAAAVVAGGYAVTDRLAGDRWHVPPDDRTVGRSGICEVHHGPMRRVTVPVAYGLLRLDEHEIALLSAGRTAFPHAEEWVEGGCVTTSLSPALAVVYRCADCERARRQWETDWSRNH